MIVDDCVEILGSWGDLLALKGYQVFTACNGKDALKILNSNCIDIVITDILMPEMDGCELITTIRSRGIATQIIAISAGSGALDHKSLLEIATMLEVDYTLPKPFHIEDLETAIQYVVNQKNN